MAYLGSWKIDDLLYFYAVTSRFDTGVVTDSDAVPSYRVYENETGTPLLTGTMSLLDASNTAGFYSEEITLSAANGFEKGKQYAIYKYATVNSVAGANYDTFQIEAEVDSNTNSNDSPGVTTLLSRITSTLFSGITSMAQWLGLIAGKQTGNSTARTELRATGAGSGTFDETTDSQEAIRDRGDSAWTTADLSTVISKLDTIDDFIDTEVSAIKSKTDNLPSDPADASDIASSFSAVNSKLDAIDDYIDTEVAAILAAVDAEVAAILADTNELQTDWVDGGRLDNILDARASQASVDDLPTNAELATALGTADDAVLAAIATVPTAVQNADALLKRDWTLVTGAASRSVLNALRFIRNKFSTTAHAGKVTVYEEDDTTEAYQKDITTDANADPIVEG